MKVDNTCIGFENQGESNGSEPTISESPASLYVSEDNNEKEPEHVHVRGEVVYFVSYTAIVIISIVLFAIYFVIEILLGFDQ